jgi:hypothetical protein
MLVVSTCVALLASAALAGSAQAAPGLDVTLVPSPQKFLIGESATLRMVVENTGDSAIAEGTATITASLPAELVATGVSPPGGFFGPNWTCPISPDGHTVTCAGPQNTFGIGVSPGATVTIPIAVDLGPSASDGDVLQASVEACADAAPACAQDTVAIPVQEKKLRLTDVDGAMPGPTAWWAGTCDLFSPATDAGSAPGDPLGCLDFGSLASGPSPNAPSPWLAAPAWRLSGVSQAGAHPDATAGFFFAVTPDPGGLADAPTGTVKTVVVDIPSGVVGNPQALPECSQAEFAASPHQCPPETQVGITVLRLATNPGGGSPTMSTDRYSVYNLEPRAGFTAEFGIPDVAVSGSLGTSIRIFAKARTDGDFGVSTGVLRVPSQFALVGQSLTFWGVPWAASHDVYRPLEGSYIPPSGVPVSNRAHYDPSWGPIRPFFSSPTECDGVQPATRLTMDSYENPSSLIPDGTAQPGVKPDPADNSWVRTDSLAPLVGECAKPPFAPAATFVPNATRDSASGLSVDITVPQNNDPPAAVAHNPDDATGAPEYWKSDAGRATAHLKKTVVVLPPDMSVNPSGAAGLEGCSDGDIGVTRQGSPPLFDNEDPFDGQGAECLAGSVIGTVRVGTPLLATPLVGEVVLGTPKSTDPRSGEMFRLFLVVRDRERGLIAKVYGSAVADPATGQLTTTFDENPRVPFEDLHLEIKGGDRGLLRTPQRCGGRSVSSQFTPWTAAHAAGGLDKTVTSGFAVGGDCSFGFAPAVDAGMSTRAARSHGRFEFRFSRRDGEQWIDGLTAELPPGLLASVKGVGLCSDGEASAGSCPPSSRIGSVTAGAGAGSPFYLERPGDVYLTRGYKGCAYGLMVRVPVEAGPFRGPLALNTIVVRQAVCVDRTDASVRAVSDPFPTIWHGVPLAVREVVVTIDRPDFMLNPSGCAAKQIDALLDSSEGATATVAVPFQAANCADLRFKPRLNLRLTGRRQVRTGRHPGVRAVVRQQGIGEAGIEKAVVRLPKSLALDVDNAQALCEFAAGTKPDLENHCPKGSIVGRARARTPLLNDDLVGNVYFVKNVRRSSTGNLIRTLPMIIVALRGEIAVNLVGESSTTRSGKLVNTFDEVPDAPVSRFNLNIRGGSNGILAVTRTRRSNINLCARPNSHVAEADMDGQNGRRHDFNVRMNTPCRKRRQSAARICRKRTNTKPALRRCVRRVKAKRARAATRRAAVQRKQAAAKRGTSRG